jgi:branched-chain amino acid aminotransferase
MKRIDLANYAAVLAGTRQPYHDRYYAMYSSVLGGVTTDPVLMQIPLDDHLVHRGDGVFDTCKCVDGAAYNLDAHLDRIERSAAAIGLRWPAGLADVRRLVLATAAAAGRRDALVRVILARGPGGFGVSPYESAAPALYIVVYALPPPFMQAHPAGASVRRSAIPPKPPPWAGVKHCNYLPNVLMKREAVDAGVDFTVGYDAAGHLTEGATENAGIVTAGRALAFPRLENVLAGTTMLRLVELAAALRQDGTLAAVEFRDITEAEVRAASELLIVGTTIDVASGCTYEGRAVGDGRPGPVARRLQELLQADIRTNPARRAPVDAKAAT